MLGASLRTAFRHPNPSLQSYWNCAQLGLLIFPLSPFIGAVGLVLATLGTWLKQYPTIIRRPLNWGFALLSVFLLVTAAFADDKTAALLGLFNFLPFFLVFAGFNTLIQTPAQLRQMSWILVVSSLPVVMFGFGQLFLDWTFKLRVLWFVLEWEIEPGGQPIGRMASIFMYANILAGYLMIVFILSLGLWLESYRQMRGQTDNKTYAQGNKRTRGIFPVSYSPCSRFPLLTFLFLSVAVSANFMALILTDSRNAWAIAIFACLAYALYQGWRILVAGVAGIAASVLCAAFAPMGVAQWFRRVVPTFFWARLNDQLYPDRPVALLRKTQWQFALSLTQQRPWTGWGLRNFPLLYEAKMQVWLGHPHNLFLMLSAETGLPTAVLFCGLLTWIFISGVQLLQNSKYLEKAEDKLIFFSYLLVFVGWVLFNTADVSLFDFRLNTLSWLLFSAISGVAYRYKQHERLQLRS
ncbi:polymerase [Nostocales cyanobacterium HT-58-2]|nr:polymerase [Nostocales cyanobacterium HT-58-2]